MTQLDLPSSHLQSEIERLPRCCPSHDDWPILAEHLLSEFPEINIADIVRELRVARDAAESCGFEPADALHVGEVIVRQQLSMLAGRVPDLARLDPERHNRGG
jgi:hypothetical protein